MRALSTEFDSGSPTESFLVVLDQFAALRSYAADAPAVGGYRVLAPRLTVRTMRAPSPGAIAAIARARMRLTGFLSVLFVGGLGLAVLAGPANCPCANTFAVAEESSIARLGYVDNADMLTTRESQSELPPLSTAALVAPDTSAAATPAADISPISEPNAAAAPATVAEAKDASSSPITTSSLEQPRAAPVVAGDDLTVADGHRLPRAEQLADRPPVPVRLAAAPSTESDVPPTLPVVEVSTPPPMAITATDAEDASVAKPQKQSVRKRVARTERAKRSVRAYRTPAVAKKKASPTDPTPPPKWAQQMFNNPWQSEAFSYTR